MLEGSTLLDAAKNYNYYFFLMMVQLLPIFCTKITELISFDFN